MSIEPPAGSSLCTCKECDVKLRNTSKQGICVVATFPVTPVQRMPAPGCFSRTERSLIGPPLHGVERVLGTIKQAWKHTFSQHKDMVHGGKYLATEFHGRMEEQGISSVGCWEIPCVVNSESDSEWSLQTDRAR